MLLACTQIFRIENAFAQTTELQSLESGLPQIEARDYDVTVIRPSQSNRVYLFKLKDPSQMPQVGRVFLVKLGQNPVMALRVLRIYPKYQQFAGKRLKTYEGFQGLETLGDYRVYERQGEIPDLGVESSKETPVVPQKPSPAPPKTETKLTPADEEDLRDIETAEKLIAELEAIDTVSDKLRSRDFYPNALTLQPGVAMTFNVAGYDAFYAPAMNIAWRRNIISPIFSRRYPKIDGLAIELGFSYYRVRGNVDNVAKLYTVLPLSGKLVYQVPLSEKVLASFYAGMVVQAVPQTVGVTEDELAMAQGYYGALGGALWFEVGPNWYFTLSGGNDFMGFGISLKY